MASAVLPAPPAAPPGTGGPAARTGVSGALPLLALAGFLSLALQRFSLYLAGGQLSLPAVVLVLTWVALVVVHRWPLSRAGTVGYLGLLAVATAATLANGNAPSWFSPSLPSLVLLVLAYVPLVLASRPAGAERAGWAFARGVVWAARLAAVLVLVQAVLQWAGLGFWDPVTLLPASIQTSGFNTAYDLRYVDASFGLAIKPNGVIFLEPSFVSLYCAIALVLEAYRLHDARPTGPAAVRGVAWMAVLVVAVALSISASGFVVLGIAALPLLWRYRDRLEIVGTAALLLLAVYLTGFFGPVLDKLGEGFTGQTSTALRLVVPYELLTPYATAEPFDGFGAGTSDAIARTFQISGLQQPTVMKAAVEYGIPFAVLVVGVVLAKALGGGRGYTGLAVALAGVWLIPSEALLSAPILALVLFMLPNMTPAGAVPAGVARTAVARDPRLWGPTLPGLGRRGGPV
ncbi:hypothetical protein [Cellulomonas endophytica]|uniref:hypothetical protein n=1 Tax=Cellulomonas endophytica TaxID=2494735 RepID=UPI001012F03B|nr:hypothetical protein [Cellulomonas endophytica]